MSILPLDFYASLAINMMSTPTVITDVIYTAVNGIDVQTIENTRTIDLALDLSDKRRMEHIFGGSVSDGTIMVYSLVELFYLDMFAASDVRRQSFFYHSNYGYRITAGSDFLIQAGCNVYLAQRHVNQDLV